MDIEMPTKYCTTCGRLLKSEVLSTFYDEDIGEPLSTIRYKCTEHPKNTFKLVRYKNSTSGVLTWRSIYA